MNSSTRVFPTFSLITLVVLGVALFLVFPGVSFAQNSCDSLSDIGSLFACFQELVAGFIFYVLFTLATFFFIWGIVLYLKDYDSEDKRKESAKFIIWGLVALFVLSSISPLVQVIRNTFNLPGGGGTTQQQGGSGNYPFGGCIGNNCQNTTR